MLGLEGDVRQREVAAACPAVDDQRYSRFFTDAEGRKSPVVAVVMAYDDGTGEDVGSSMEHC